MPTVRVQDPISGHEHNASAEFAEAAGLKVVDKPTHDTYGQAIPAKPRTDKSGKAASRPADLKEN